MTDWVKWECPNCEEEHDDPKNYATCCRKCGLVVLTGFKDGEVTSLNWYADLDNHSEAAQ